MSQIIKNKEEIIKYFEKGSKPKKLWKIGTEHEKFLYDLNTLQPINYDGDNSCLLYTSPSPRDKRQSRMPSCA